MQFIATRRSSFIWLRCCSKPSSSINQIESIYSQSSDQHVRSSAFSSGLVGEIRSESITTKKIARFSISVNIVGRIFGYRRHRCVQVSSQDSTTIFSRNKDRINIGRGHTTKFTESVKHTLLQQSECISIAHSMDPSKLVDTLPQ